MTHFIKSVSPFLSNSISNLARFNGRPNQGYLVRSLKESSLVASIWFVIALNHSLPSGLSSKIPILNLENTASVETIRKAWGQGDAGSLLDIAITWANFKKLDPITQYWIPGLWSPGLSILEVPLIWISRAGIPIYWSILLVTLTLWSLLFSLVWRHFSQFTGRIPMALVSIGLLWSWDFIYLLKDFIFYTEGIGFALLFIGLVLLSVKVISPEKTSNRYIYLSGTLIGISIWIRHTNESGLILLFLMACAFNFKSKRWQKLYRKKGKKKGKRDKNALRLESRNSLPQSFSRIGIFTSGIALLVTLPWRLISTYHFNGAPFLMSSASGGVPETIWALPNSASGQYWGVYGANWACKIDLETCNNVQSGISDGSLSNIHLLLLAIQSVLSNPINYINERSEFLWANWIPSFSLNFSYQNLAALIFMPLAFYCLYMCVVVKDKRKYVMVSIWGSFLFMNLVQLSIIHYESRYFIPVRLLLLGLLLSLISLKNTENKTEAVLTKD